MLNPTPSDTAAAFVEADGLAFAYGGHLLFTDLSFELGPGLSLIQGGDGRGKSTLLRLIAGELAPTGGRIRRASGPLSFETPADPAHDPLVARAWLADRQRRFPAWRADTAAALIERFGLTPHIDKPMFMLSTGSRRKVGLVASAASAAALTLLDTPFAALDSSARQVLAELLTNAAGSTTQAWVMADYSLPDAWADRPLAGHVDLG